MNACTQSAAVSEDVPRHHTAGGFQNLYGSAQQHKGLWPYLKMRYFDERFPELPSAFPFAAIEPDHELISQPQHDLQLTWIGHASALIQIGGRNILADPVFGERASPLPVAGPKRYSKPGLSLAQLPPIHYVVISHNHYDHLERETVEQLGDSVQWLVPLGLKAWFNDLGVTRVVELDWWQQAALGGVQFTLTPTQHWSRRGFGDTNATLWGSWVVEAGGRKVWFGGDTGYAQPLFQEIGRRLGPFDLALIPIGGYGPRWFMQEKHADPDDAVRIHQDLGARYSIGIHWGTFILTSEPVEEPPQLLAQALARYGVPQDRFLVLQPGQTWALRTQTTAQAQPADKETGGVR
ncbi:MBL fold metallo-hydrolase [Chitiniphilus purpureus]|uniref:MBL fold metallo-hydrolase n=1 Tax=Chitiniphilus purpureus TaxID=2981137 RepID=A0ABY6DRZ5_9NEIS|nr:MBL fold metallo-hydrolase [Chitiniphilus sp. CD1]UXY17139.1 MBL fold metallo-hydrolase [Chitiniphilus sp. CD1]